VDYYFRDIYLLIIYHFHQVKSVYDIKKCTVIHNLFYYFINFSMQRYYNLSSKQNFTQVTFYNKSLKCLTKVTLFIITMLKSIGI